MALTLGAAAMVASGLVGPAPSGAATYPGLNGKIVCASSRGANGIPEIFSFNPNGTEFEATNLTNDPAVDGDPAYSPDGREIAFESTRSGSTEIWLMNADGSNPRRLTSTGANLSPTWHPDGSQIAFQSLRGAQLQVFKINIDGSGQTQLTDLALGSSLPAWSPDGTQIAFSRRGQDPAADVFIMDPFGKNVVNLTNSVREDSWPTWSPDGTQIAFHSRLDDVAGEEIYKINVDGTGRTRLTNNIQTSTSAAFDVFPFWSPDGTRIGWNSGRGGSGFGDAYHMDAVIGDSVIVRVTNSPTTDQRCDWQPLCTIYGSGAIVGTEGDDIICGSAGSDSIHGRGGNDRILGLGGNDSINGGDGDDTVLGGNGDDTVQGGSGSDFISAGPANDVVLADPNERVDPGSGADRCSIGGNRTCPPRLS